MTVALVLAGLAAWQTRPAEGQQATMRIVGPTSVSLGAASFEVRVDVEGVTNLASYEWQIAYDRTRIELTDPPASAVSNAGFLGSTGRMPTCLLYLPPGVQDVVIPEGSVRFGCVTLSLTPPGPDGGGTLSTLRFRPVGEGPANLNFALVGVSHPEPTDPMNVTGQGACIVVGTGSCAPPTPLPTYTPINPGVPTSTPIPGQPAATPTPPAAPPPPPVLPGPGYEEMSLAAGCNFEAWTGADSTQAATVAAGVSPQADISGLWAQQPVPIWRGYHPAYPQASDMEPLNNLDVLAICMAGPGWFVRPLI
jgi:hypothetical protein